MSERTDREKAGGAAATKRAKAALVSQDNRRARRPLESGTPAVAKRAAKATTRNMDQSTFVLETPAPSADTAPPNGADADLARLGIVAVPKTVFEWGGYRYTNAVDAIAAARRGPSA